MIRLTKHRKTMRRESIAPAKLPKGVKVVPAPKNALQRELLSGPDIETSGGARTVHSKPKVAGS
jgi:hypothetical protein